MGTFDDREKMQDILDSQKYIAEQYNCCAGECSDEAKKDKLMNILAQEHEMQFQIFSEMKRHGWCVGEPADKNDVSSARQRFEKIQKEL